MNVSSFLDRLKSQGLKELTLENAERRAGIRRSILLAIVYVESGGDAKAMRYEEGFRWTHREKNHARNLNITTDTETQLQKFSYGLAQVMGGTARSECKMFGPLTDLLDPNVNIRIASTYLQKLMFKYNSVEDTISAYNQGSPRKKMFSKKYKNQAYVDKVLQAAWELGYRGELSKTS